ncbi:MAG TPA: PHB depolymerase family esterase [Acidimicrobiales bacterium]|nr:PHB depolymerase family esterase [Acidimicrobiales bacterium]
MRRIPASVLLIALAGLATACKEVPTQGAAPAAPTGACSAPKPAPTGPITITSGGSQRTYLLALPDPPPSKPARVIVNLHGAGSDAVEQAIYSGLAVEGPARGFVVATPDATGQPKQWNVIGETKSDDVTFIHDMLADVAARACVDETHVYATGISSGAAMSSLLACKDGAQFSVIAPVSGVVFFPWECSEGPPVTVISFHGTADPVLPYNGGPILGVNSGFPYPGVAQGMAGWGNRAGCAATPTSTAVSAHVTLEQWTGCAPGTSIELYTVNGGGHTWPGAAIKVRLLGPTTDEINATDIMLDAFSK